MTSDDGNRVPGGPVTRVAASLRELRFTVRRGESCAKRFPGPCSATALAGLRVVIVQPCRPQAPAAG